MKQRNGFELWAALIVIAIALPAAAQSPTTPLPGSSYGEWKAEKERDDDAPLSEFRLINYFFVRASLTNQLADPSGLAGVSLGPIGMPAGSSTRVGRDTAGGYIEQRWIPVIEYAPWFVDGLATFRAQFEVDFTWGRAANSMQHNQGGGFNADQINIQTKNVNVSLYPTHNPNDLAIVIGTQSIYDSIYDPARVGLTDIIKTGYKLAYLGTDATGISAYSSYGNLGHGKLSFIPMGSAQPDRALLNDPSLAFVYLMTADYAYPIQPGTVLGLSLWRLQDDTKGDAYAYEGLVKSGPSSSGLGSFTGTQRFNIEKPTGSVNYVGANFHHNVDFRTGPFAASGFVMYNRGSFTSSNPDTLLNKSVLVDGLGANLELAWNYGRTAADVISLEGMFSTGDSDPSDGKYSSAFTTNYYGLPGAVWFNHKTLLLFPFTSTVSNYNGAVSDISNQGFGLQAGILSAAYDLIPHKLNLKLGGAFAQSGVTPPELTAGVARGRTIGTEINAEIKYHIRYLMTVGLHGGYMFRGDFYNGSEQVTADPYALFTTFTWYGF
ncbi:MAG: hypothetical protein WBV82_30765 [Myxococcaceae bacterium]